MNKKIFALDIGTRSVTGILMEKQGKDFIITGCHTEEHEERAMLDGQIHNVLQVTEIIQKVKNRLEKGGEALESVYVAAAGRSLKTKRASATLPLQQALSTPEMITNLEFSAVYQAQSALTAENEDSPANNDYYCVGYSIVEYRIDGERIGSLIDQTGNHAEAEVIATFLPKVVVESLLAALERADLQMEALTLEPIAAIRVLVPESMRRLNIALVDIGAGTSDIAITDDGTVSAYGMVPCAGDEITEKISDVYLLDYPLAEEMKRSISNEGQASVQDILGFETTVTLDEFMETIEPAAELLANSITQEIIKLNGSSPRAVMMIGGGSLTPGLPKLIARKLELPENRVAVRSIDAIQHLQNADLLPNGPDFVTPVGIAIAADEKPVHYITVHVNKKPIRMFEMRELTVGDSIVQAGIELGKFYGKPGEGMIVTLNGQPKTIPGTLGKGPKLFVNDKEAKATTPIKAGDKIEIRQGQDGLSVETRLKDIASPPNKLEIHINGEPKTFKPVYMINDMPAEPDQLLKDGDHIIVSNKQSAADLLDIAIGEQTCESKGITVYANSKTVRLLPNGAQGIMINGEMADVSEQIHDGDRIDYISGSDTYAGNAPTVQHLLEKLELQTWQTALVFFEGKPVELKEQKLRILRDDVEIELDETLSDLDDLRIIEKEMTSFIFQDVFRYVVIDLSGVNGRFELQVNDEKAAFDSPIYPGDQLAIKWLEK